MRLFSLFVLVLSAQILCAQAKHNSPYSQYGLGDPLPQYSFMTMGMGGLSAAFNDPYHLNIRNPASYAHLSATTLEGGFYAKNSHLKSTDAKLQNWSGNLSYLSLGMTLNSPINEALERKKRVWHYGLGIALEPVSSIGYNVVTEDSLPQFGSIINAFQGYGGYYRFKLGFSAKRKQTSAGMHIGWQLGTGNFELTEYFDSIPSFQTNREEEVRINGLVWDLGVQHDFILGYAKNDIEIPTKWLTIGATGHTNLNINAISNNLLIRSRGKNSAGNYIQADTLQSDINKSYDLTLPAEFTLGAMYVKAHKLRVGADFGYIAGSAFSNKARPNSGKTRNAVSIQAGAEIIPNYLSYNNYSKRIRYRFGGYYRQDIRMINDKGLDDVGVSFGFGLPLILPRQQTSFINLGFELGKIGIDTPIDESYIRMTFGYTFNDNSWFFKRQFN